MMTKDEETTYQYLYEIIYRRRQECEKSLEPIFEQLRKIRETAKPSRMDIMLIESKVLGLI